MEDRELFQNFSQEFKALDEDKQPIILEITKIHAWILLSQLQLALRHPQNSGPTSQIVRGIAEKLQAAVASTPALAEVARRGWDSNYDVEVTDG